MPIPPNPDDVSLLKRIAQGEQAALSALYDRYGKIIYAFALKSLRSVEESEEVVMDVFAQVWRIGDRYDAQKGRVDTWLFTIARSRILDRVRKLQRTQSATTFSIDAVEIQPQADSVDLFEEVFIAERRHRMMAAMKALPDEQRFVLELAYYQGLSHSQIAAQTGISLGTIKTRIRLGLNKLKSIIATEDNW